MECVITHNLRDRFETEIEGHRASVVYHNQNGVLRITHTYVPPELEGQGIAAALTKALLDYATEHSLPVVPVCSYSVAYFKRNNIVWKPL